MQNKYCLPIIKKSKEEVLQTIQENENDYHFFEVWLDYVEDLFEIRDPSGTEDLETLFVEELIKKYGERLILLFRRQKLETVKMEDRQREEIMSLLHESESMLDLDITTQQNDALFIKNNRLIIKKVLSYHNYEMTPSDGVLLELVNQMEKHLPFIYKISTKCLIEKDAVRLLQFLLFLKEQNRRHIVLGMGKHGAITRIFGTLWGNEMSFAPRSLSESSAPGQLTRQQLEDVFAIIEKKD